MRSDPALSLIVCTLGRGDCLARLLDSLAAQSEPDFEIILVDQNPPGRLDALLARHGAGLAIRHLRSRPGLSRARNVGLGQSCGGIVAFPDDDCWYDPSTVAEALAFFAARPDIALMTGRTVDADGAESVTRHLERSGPITRDNVFLAGNSNTIFARREVVAAISGFDETLGAGAGTPYLSGEETDFILRAMAAGFKAWFAHEFRVRHAQNATAEDAIKRAEAYSAGFGRLLRLHAYGPAFLGTRVARATLRGLYCLATGDRAGARSRFRWARGSIRGYAGRAAAPPT